MIRLARKPSLWVNFFGRLVFGVVWAGAFIALSYFVWPRRASTPIFILFILGFFDLLAIGVIWDLVVRFWRTEEHPESVATRQPACDGKVVSGL